MRPMGIRIRPCSQRWNHHLLPPSNCRRNLRYNAAPIRRIGSHRLELYAAVGRPRNSTANWKIACENRLPATMKRPPMKPPEQNDTARAAIHP